jgi:transposase-like protein
VEFQWFERLRAEIGKASASQVLDLERLIGVIASHQVAEMALARRTEATTESRKCPHCASENAGLHGKDANGRQRFKCRGCRRTYNILTGTAMARARKPEKWGQYLSHMTEFRSVRKIVQNGIGLNQVTVWRWRQRFLKMAANDNAEVLSGVVEADEAFFLRSFKGSRGWKKGTPPENRAARPRAWGGVKRGLSHAQVPVLTALDNAGGIFEAILPVLNATAIETAMKGLIASNSVLCSDGAAAYEAIADAANAEHRVVHIPVTTLHAVKLNPIPTPARQSGRLGLGRVNSHHQRLRAFVDGRCRGVATKYLGSYLGWHRAMSRAGFEGKSLLGRAMA